MGALPVQGTRGRCDPESAGARGQVVSAVDAGGAWDHGSEARMPTMVSCNEPIMGHVHMDFLLIHSN